MRIQNNGLMESCEEIPMAHDLHDFEQALFDEHKVSVLIVLCRCFAASFKDDICARDAQMISRNEEFRGPDSQHL